MPEEITFTTAAFGGFEKKQVLDYIYKTHEEIDNERNKHQKKLNEISIAFKELEARAVHAEQLVDSLNHELSEIRIKYDNEKKSNTQLVALNEELTLKLGQSERILAQRKQQEIAPEASSSIIEPFSFPEPSFGFNAPPPTPADDTESTSQIGRVMLEAHSKANNIINDAKLEADKIINDARFAIEQNRQQQEQSIEQHRRNAENAANQLINLANKQVYDNLSKAYAYARSMMDEITNATATAQANFTTINEQVTNLEVSTETMKTRIKTTMLENINIPVVTIPTPPTGFLSTPPPAPVQAAQPPANPYSNFHSPAVPTVVSSPPPLNPPPGRTSKYDQLFETEPPPPKPSINTEGFDLTTSGYAPSNAAEAATPTPSQNEFNFSAAPPPEIPPVATKKPYTPYPSID